MKIKRVVTFIVDDANEIAFQPSDTKRGVYEVWVDGVHLEDLEPGERPSEVRAQYYYEVHCKALAEELQAPENDYVSESASPPMH